MVKKRCTIIPILFLLFLNILISVSAQQAKELDVDVTRPGPEFIINWRYSDFSDNARADEVVNLVDNAVKNAWEKIITQWDFSEPLDTTIDIYIQHNLNI